MKSVFTRVCCFEPISEDEIPIITLEDAYSAGLDEKREYDMIESAFHSI